MSVRAVLALIVLVPATLLGMALQALLLSVKAPAARHLPVLYHRLLLAVIGVRLNVRGQPSGKKPLLVTANHSSWLDIPVIGSLGPASFIAKSEVSGWPLIGWLAKLQRTIFVDRARRQDTARVNARIARRLAAGDTMILFAEGTSSDGNRVLPFRSALVGAVRDAIDAEGDGRVWLQPLSIAYTRINGLPTGRVWRPRVAWYGGMSLAPHLLGVLSLGAIDIDIVWGEPLAVTRSDDRKAIARTLETRVRAAFTEAVIGRPAAAAAPEPSVTEPPSLPHYSHPSADPLEPASQTPNEEGPRRRAPASPADR